MIQIRRFSAEAHSQDLAFGKRLSDIAEWNQRIEDWQRLELLDPEGFFVALVDGEPAGTVGSAAFGQVGWVAMMLVAPEHRRKGVATALLEEGLSWLASRDVVSVRLDATPAGEPLYRRFGFEPQFDLMRYGGTVAPLAADGNSAQDAVRELSMADLPEIARLDEHITHTARSRLIAGLVEAADPLAIGCPASGPLAGFALARPGRLAIQLGPLIAADKESGSLLIRNALRRLAGHPVFADIPVDHAASASWAARAGLAPLRLLRRMCRGPKVIEELPGLWVSSGPEMG